MSQAEDAWYEVGEQLRRLGVLFKDHYEAQESEAEPSVSEEDVAEAMRTLGAGMKAVLGATGDTLSDPELVTETRETAGAIFTALGATFSELGSQVAPTPEGEEESTTSQSSSTDGHGAMSDEDETTPGAAASDT